MCSVLSPVKLGEKNSGGRVCFFIYEFLSKVARNLIFPTPSIAVEPTKALWVFRHFPFLKMGHWEDKFHYIMLFIQFAKIISN